MHHNILQKQRMKTQKIRNKYLSNELDKYQLNRYISIYGIQAYVCIPDVVTGRALEALLTGAIADHSVALAATAALRILCDNTRVTHMHIYWRWAFSAYGEEKRLEVERPKCCNTDRQLLRRQLSKRYNGRDCSEDHRYEITGC